jgi:Fe-S cluster assembly protein SufD
VDKDELFYLMARGIPDQEARTLITLGFLEDVFTRLNDDALQAAVCQRLEEKFAVPY